jgi:hypothetical protein
MPVDGDDFAEELGLILPNIQWSATALIEVCQPCANMHWAFRRR